MTDRDDHDHEPTVFDHADDPVVADPIGPEIALVAVQGFAQLARVTERD
jgi:hypothetical protein